MSSNHNTHTMYHMLYIVMSIQDVSIYPLCPTIWIILYTRITFLLRYVICLILSCLSIMCSFIRHVQCFIMSCSFGLRPPSDVSSALYCHVHLCVLYCLVYFDCFFSSVLAFHRTHTIPDPIPSEHDNAKHMINRMGGIHSDCTRQTNAYDTFDYRTLLGWTWQSKAYRTTDCWPHSELTR
jgi:hypothetical protein